MLGLKKEIDFWQLLLVLLVVYFLLLYLSVFRPLFGLVQVDLYIDTDHAGAATTFLPKSDGTYHSDSSRTVSFPNGSSGHRFGFRYQPSQYPFRFDPTAKIGKVAINKISFSHLGFTRVFTGAELMPFVAKCDQANCLVENEALVIDATGNDPKLLISGSVVPSISLMKMLALALIVGLLCFVPITYFFRHNGSVAPSYLAVIVPIIAINTILYFVLLDSASPYAKIVESVAYSLAMVFGVLGLAGLVTNRSESISHAIIIVVSFLVITLGFTFSTTKPLLEEVGNTLSPKPDENTSVIKKITKFRDEFEQIYAKYLAGSKQLINWDARLKVFGLGFTPNPKSILGKDQWFFEGHGSRRVEQDIVQSYDNITDYMGLIPFNTDELEQWRVAIEERYYWLKERSIDYVFVLAPTKALVYPEKLPERIGNLKNQLNKPTRYDQLVAYLQRYSDVPVVDLQSELVASKDAHPWPLYYRTDFHWNYLGSYYAYKATIKTINEHYPDYEIAALPIEEFRIESNNEWAHHSFLRLAGLNPAAHKNDTYLKLYPLDTTIYENNSPFYTQGIFDGTIPRDQAVKYGSNQVSLRTLENQKGTLNRIFVIGDSFSEKMLGYFSAHAKTVYNYRAVTQFAPDPIEYLKPQLVIQEILSMYVLNKPPNNTPAIKAARSRFLDSH